MKTRILSVILALCILTSVLGLMTGCSAGGETVAVQQVSMILGIGTTSAIDRSPGKVVSSNVLEVFKTNDEKISQINIKVGDEVKKGDVLFSYDVQTLTLTYNKLLLEKEQYQNLIDSIKKQITELKKDSGKGDSAQKLENTIQIQTAEIEQKEAEYSLESINSQIEDAKKLIENSNYTVNIDGRVASIKEEYINGGSSSEQPFITIVESGALRVQAKINELRLSSISEGDRVIVRSRADSKVYWRGSIASIQLNSPDDGESSEGGDSGEYNVGYYGGGDGGDAYTQSSSYPFFVTLDDPTGLILGQHVFVEKDVGQCDDGSGIRLPSYYIVTGEGEAYVWKANGRRLTKARIELGEYDLNSDTYVVISGITLDDYIAFPDDTCTEGAGVEKIDEASFIPDEGDFGAAEDFGSYEEGEYYGEGDYADGGEFLEGGEPYDPGMGTFGGEEAVG